MRVLEGRLVQQRMPLHIIYIYIYLFIYIGSYWLYLVGDSQRLKINIL